jgi:hypothetical protein
MPAILATWEAETERITDQGQPGQKVSETPNSANSWMWWYTPVIPSYEGVEIRRIWFQASLCKKDCKTPSQQKRLGTVVLYLSSQQQWEAQNRRSQSRPA